MTTRLLAPSTGLIFALLASAGGCGGSSSPLSVQVRDRGTGEPARGVLVIADVPNRNHPLSVASLLGQTKEYSTRSRTDDAGRVVLAYSPGRTVRLSVLEPGWAGGVVLFDPQTVEPGTWFTQEGSLSPARAHPEYAIQPLTGR